MNNIQPLSSFYQVTHSDLIKFGIDMTQKAKAVSSGISNSNKISDIFFSSQLPQIVSALKSKDIIKIKKSVKNKNCELEVDRETGFIIKENKMFNHISKFNPSSFPDKISVDLENVAYWDLYNNYITPE